MNRKESGVKGKATVVGSEILGIRSGQVFGFAMVRYAHHGFWILD